MSENHDRPNEVEEFGDEYRKPTIICFPATLGITG